MNLNSINTGKKLELQYNHGGKKLMTLSKTAQLRKLKQKIIKQQNLKINKNFSSLDYTFHVCESARVHLNLSDIHFIRQAHTYCPHLQIQQTTCVEQRSQAYKTATMHVRASAF